MIKYVGVISKHQLRWAPLFESDKDIKIPYVVELEIERETPSTMQVRGMTYRKSIQGHYTSFDSPIDVYDFILQTYFRRRDDMILTIESNKKELENFHVCIDEAFENKRLILGHEDHD